jgi:hypothetical protein
MGLSKHDEFTVRDNRIARYAKALAHAATSWTNCPSRKAR